MKKYSLGFFLTVIGLAGLASPAKAADYYLQVDMPSGTVWTTTSYSTYWNTSPTGEGSSPSSINSGDNYYSNGHVLRAGDTAFVGNVFVSGTNLILKDTSGGQGSVGNLTLSGAASITNGNGYVNDISITNLVTTLNHTTTIATGSSASYGVSLIVGTLSGAGNFNITGSGSSLWTVTTATAFTGTLTLTTGTLDFNADFYAPSASLSVASGSKFTLDKAVTVSSLTIAGSALAADTYTYAYLNANYGSIFTSGDANGSITVAAIPEPSTCAALAGALVLAGAVYRRRKTSAHSA